MAKSNEMGSGCAMAFFGVFLIAGCAAFVGMMYGLVLPEVRANFNYVEHTCVVLNKRLGESQGDDGTTYRPEIFIRYEVNGQEFRTWTYDAIGVHSSGRSGKEAILAQFRVGAQVPCWYDPAEPSRAVLVRGFSWLMYLFLLIPLIFVAVGGGGIYSIWSKRGKSPEQLAAGAASPTDGGSEPFPTVPNKELRPGERLKYELRLANFPGVSVLGLLFFAVFWNGIVSIFVGVAVAGHREGKADWCMTTFLVPFVLVGVLVIVMFIRQLLIWLGTRPSDVEISDHPLQPGQKCQFYLVQEGRLRLHELRVLVVCEESASYRQGTDTRTETKRVAEVELFRKEQFDILAGEPFAIERDFLVPVGAMHSFEASHNKVQWKLLVKGNVVRWPSFEWEYPIVVRPVDGRGKKP